MKKGVGMRITKVYTKTGDKGKTRLAGGQQVWKDSCAGRGLWGRGRTEFDDRGRSERLMRSCSGVIRPPID